MADIVTVTTRTGYGSRVGNSIKGIVLGFILFIASFGVLWSNEGNFVKVSKGLSEGRDAVVILDSPKVDPANDDKLIYTTGQTAVGDTPLVDTTFDVKSNSLLLRRNVEMYQWKEEEKSETREHIGGEEETVTTYTYTKEWSDEVISSSNFHTEAGHTNPGTFPYSKQEYVAADATLGDFALQSSTIKKIGGATTIPVDAAMTKNVAGAQTHGEYVYIGKNPSTPTIGDVRVSFSEIKPGTISVIAQQSKNTLVPFTTKTKSTIELVSSGTKSADALFTAAEEANQLTTWMFRGVGLVMMWLGLTLIAGPVSMILAFFPPLRWLASGLMSLVAIAITFVLGGLTIALAWLYYRPLVSLAVIIGAGLITGLVIFMLKKKSPAPIMNTAPQPVAAVAQPVAPQVVQTATQVPTPFVSPQAPVPPVQPPENSTNPPAAQPPQQ